MGNAKDLNSICREGINLVEHPVLDALVTGLDRLYEFGVKEFDYKELKEGYVSKCHLCIDIRKHIIQKTDEFEELNPKDFYCHLC